MTTTVSKTIGTGGDYSTIALWFADLSTQIGGTNLVSADKIYQGKLKNQNFDVSGTAQTFSGFTADSTRYLELTTDTGASFLDNANVQTNALRYNTSNGASISSTSNYASVITNSVDYTRINKIQFATTAAHTQSYSGNNRVTIDKCIFEGANGGGIVASSVSSGTALFTNCLFVQRLTAANCIVSHSGTWAAINCTFATPSDLTASTFAFAGNYATPTLTNVAAFGCSTVGDTNKTAYSANTTCYSSASTRPTGFSLLAYNTSTGSGFVNIADSTRDFKIQAGSGLLDVGTTDATNAATDIAGTSRPQASAYDVGAWELVSAVVALGIDEETWNPMEMITNPLTISVW